MKTALLAGTHSGCGKTTVMLALLQYFCARQKTISAFKTGPDFLDPLWHQAVTGQASYNLDTQMIGIEHSRRILARHQQHSEYALIEGVMGLFDGRSGVGGPGSAADLAKQLQVSVILVIDAQGLSGSVVALVSGYCDVAAKLGVGIVGIVANKVGSDHHATMLSELLRGHALPPLLAWLSRDAEGLTERHLGLVRPGENALPDLQAALTVDAQLLEQAFLERYVDSRETVIDSVALHGKTVAIARDAACCFIYPDNLDCLRQMGANLQFFSPIAGEPIPEQANALWLPGGYPELYAEQLSQSPSLTTIKQFIDDGKPVLAECGGAMLLGEQLVSKQGVTWPMAKVLPFMSRMQTQLAALGYRQSGTVTGHEFHYSVRESAVQFDPAFEVDQGDRGIRYKNLRASYIHWYFASAPSIIKEWFL
jgi:cobyrinic acid a,c-diamide synthase